MEWGKSAKHPVGMYYIEPGKLMELLPFAIDKYKDRTEEAPQVLIVREEHLIALKDEGTTILGMRVYSMKEPLMENHIVLARDASDFIEV